MFKSIFWAAICISSVAVHTASADPGATYWSTIGSGCIVDTTTGALANVDASNVKTTFSGSNTGTIHITCPVSAFQTTIYSSANPNTMKVTFLDTDGTTDNCTIKAYLYTYSATATGSVAEIVRYDGAADTTLASSSPFRNYEATSTFSHTFNWDDKYQLVYIDLFRNTTSCNVSLLGSQLTWTPVIP
jgi:hypothetical protein